MLQSVCENLQCVLVQRETDKFIFSVSPSSGFSPFLSCRFIAALFNLITGKSGAKLAANNASGETQGGEIAG